MTHCCSAGNSSEQHPKKFRCPVNGREYSSVKLNTLMLHIQKPWGAKLTDQGYYFCDDPNCDVVYFAQDGSVFNKQQVRTTIWQKVAEQDSDVCYCFGATHQQASENKDILEFIQAQTREGHCSCETRNPSGRCCLKDFPKQ